jgi:hypothetical protein
LLLLRFFRLAAPATKSSANRTGDFGKSWRGILEFV